MKVSVRQMVKSDIDLIVDYFMNATPDLLTAMGADKTKLPNKTAWIKKLNIEFDKPNEKKEFYYIIWLLDNQPVGHSNINKIQYGKSATMHLHLWNGQNRKKGIGAEFLKRSLPFYFKNFNLENLVCEPYSENIAPNKILRKVGFQFIKKYETTPGWINFLQYVNRYELTKTSFKKQE